VRCCPVSRPRSPWMEARKLNTRLWLLQVAYQHAIALARAAGGPSEEDLADAYFGLGEALASCAEQVEAVHP